MSVLIGIETHALTYRYAVGEINAEEEASGRGKLTSLVKVNMLDMSMLFLMLLITTDCVCGTPDVGDNLDIDQTLVPGLLQTSLCLRQNKLEEPP